MTSPAVEHSAPADLPASRRARPPVLSVQDLHLTYGLVQAVRGISFDVRPGQVLGILGGNGAGKSSTLKAVAGVLPVTQGRITVAGHDMTDPRQSEAGKRALGYCPDVGGLVRAATVREHLELLLSLRGTPGRSNPELWRSSIDLIGEFGLTAVIDRPVGGFSHGMMRRASVALAAIAAERVLVLDEPFDGVDPLGVEATKAVVARAVGAGLGVVVCTHLLDLLVSTCHDVVVLARGRVVASVPSSHLRGPAGTDRYRALLVEADAAARAAGEIT